MTDVTRTAGTPPVDDAGATPDGGGFVPLFDGVSMAGWHAAPRIYGSVYPGGPSVL